MAKEIAEEYASSLADLTVNSKPLINMLTILAEENIEHAGVIVETVEKHLEKVPPDIKLPVLYLVDSIIKNVGGAYTQKFSQSIVSMFTKTFKQVDEKIRSQMFKLRETWHDVFPSTKLYQLDVKVNLIDPAWPIQAQPHQSNIHSTPTTSTTPLTADEEKMRSVLAKKEQELLMLQRKKVEMELEQTRRQLQLAEKTTKKVPAVPAPVAAVPVAAAVAPPVALPAVTRQVVVPPADPPLSVKQRLGPPVNKPPSASRIAPVSAALASARRDPRLARRAPPAAPAPAPAPATPAAPAPAPAAPIAPNVFDIKPLDRGHVTVTKRKNVITIDVRPDAPERPRARRRPDEPIDAYMQRLRVPDPKRIDRLPPIPKLPRAASDAPADTPPVKRKKDPARDRKKRREGKPEEPAKVRKVRERRERAKAKERASPDAPAPVAFKELRNYHKERYMRRNKEKSESPERPEPAAPEEPANPPELVPENKDVDLRVLHPVITETAAPIAQKRPSTEALEGKVKKNKLEKFDILFGNEDVDLRQLPQVDEVSAPPPPSITENNSKAKEDSDPEEKEEKVPSPVRSPRKDWQEVKEKEEIKKTPSKLDLVRAKLAEATKGKDGLGRPLLFSKSPSIEKERRRTLSSDETDVRTDNVEDFDAEDHKKTISIIMNQAKEQFSDGQLDKNQYNALMYQVLQLNEKLKLKEAKQRESLEVSKRKLNAHTHTQEENKVSSPRSSPTERNKYGDIDERITPAPFMNSAPENQNHHHQDSDMRMNHNGEHMEGNAMFPMPPMMPMFMGPYGPRWRGQLRPRIDEFGMRRFRGPVPPYFRGKFDKRLPRPPFEPRLPLLPTPKIGMCQGESPLQPYERSISPPPLGAPGYILPPTDYKIIEYIDQDPVKTIQIDNIPREIRFYGETAIIMLDWDDPREIKFLPGSRRVTFDNKDSVVLSFNEGYKQVEIDDQVFDIRFGAPTRELYINGRWYECFFGGQPLGVIIDGKPRLIHLEGPLPKVDIGKTKRTDLVAGKINLIVNATNICPVYLDAKVQKFQVNGQFFTIRFVDSLRTVLINEQPFKVEFGDLPKPIFVGGEKYFVRFSALPKNVKPGQIEIADMEGTALPEKKEPAKMPENENDIKETKSEEPVERPQKSPSPEVEMKGLDMLASLMPTSMAPASSSEYTSAEPLFTKSDKIPGLETPSEEKPANSLPLIGSINVNDLYAKLVATGIVPMLNDVKTEAKNEKTEEVKPKPKEDKNVIHKVDLLKSETLRVKQPGIVSRLYGGMQCSGCGARFPPEHTVRYSQHLDWHFRQNRRERDSARRAHSRHWHYDLSDWLQYEELEDLEEREKSWFDAPEEAAPPPDDAPSEPAAAPLLHCALCGDRFHQFYNEDREEWHLRNSVRHDRLYYHPLCLQDYKASLTKEEPPKEETPMETSTEEEKPVEAIEIKDDDTKADADESDNESVVEVVEPETEPPEPVEIDEGDEDDVVLKAEPVEQVVVEDADTDDETAAERASRDQQAEIDFANIKIKQEPIDPDDEPIITAEVESTPPIIDTTHNTVMSSIDGNVQLDEATPAPVFPLGGIRINISKSIPSFVNTQEEKMLEDVSVDDEPLPPGEEPELEYKLKPALEGVHLSRQPPVQKGSELSGLCSIM